jgi:hypothetical protein
MLCANLADPVPAGAARGRDLAVASVASMSVGHGPPPVAHGCGAAPGLSTGHGPLRVARGRGPAVAAGLQWTCGPDSSAGGQQQTTCS